MISRLARLMMLAIAGIKQVALPAAKLRLLQWPKGPQLIWNSASFSYARAHCAGIGKNSEGGQPKWLQERHPDGRNRWNPCSCKAAKDATLSLSKYLQIFRDCTAGFLFLFKASQPNSDCDPRTSRLAKSNPVLLSMANHWIPITYTIYYYGK